MMDTSEFDEMVLSVVRRVTRKEGAMWTADLAWTLRERTPTVRASLGRLEKAGKVRRVVTGNPISWEASEPPPAATEEGR